MSLHDPQFGEVYRRKQKRSLGGETQTRHVIDRTFGGDVLYVEGRFRANAYRVKVSKEQWLLWADGASLVRVDSGFPHQPRRRIGPSKCAQDAV